MNFALFYIKQACWGWGLSNIVSLTGSKNRRRQGVRKHFYLKLTSSLLSVFSAVFPAHTFLSDGDPQSATVAHLCPLLVSPPPRLEDTEHTCVSHTDPSLTLEPDAFPWAHPSTDWSHVGYPPHPGPPPRSVPDLSENVSHPHTQVSARRSVPGRCLSLAPLTFH